MHFDSFTTNYTDSIQYGYFENLLEYSNNKRLKRWAHRNNYQIIGFNVINTSSQFRKGYQLKFYHKGKRLNLVRNEWAAKKARQKGHAVPFIALPFAIIETAILNNDDDDQLRDEYGFQIAEQEFSPITTSVVESNNKVRKQANKNLRTNLTKNDISHQVLPFGVPVYGIIIIDSKAPVDDIEVRLQ